MLLRKYQLVGAEDFSAPPPTEKGQKRYSYYSYSFFLG